MIKQFKVTSKLLKQKRNVSIYIPDNHKGPFKVLYMHDGQNLFFKESSSYGEIWDAHTQYERFIKAGLIEPHIIVGIDNTKNRMDEYAPFDNSSIYKYYSDEFRVQHYGDVYAKFIVEELKPWVDKKFKTKPDKSDTLMIGASLGGLISLYCGLTYPDVFGGIGCLSTSAWWNPAAIDVLLDLYKAKPDQRYFITCGSNEYGKNDINDNRDYTRVSKKINKYLHPHAEKVFYKVYDGGIHNETLWAAQLSEFAQFMKN